MTRGQLDNENNNQSQDSNISNNIHGESLMYGVREQSISWGYWKRKWEHIKAMYIAAKHCSITSIQVLPGCDVHTRWALACGDVSEWVVCEW